MSELIVPSRRGFLAGLGSFFVAAPAIVRAASIMPVKAVDLTASLLSELQAIEGRYVPGQLFEELAAVTRRAFVPRIYVQIWKEPPSLAWLLDQQVTS
jgi:hypothetical protein